MKTLIFLVLILVFIPACASGDIIIGDKAVEENEIIEPRGNSLGNIINKGLAVQKGEWVYYQNRDDKDKIYLYEIGVNH